ncbi:MAG: TonB-dependent receptor [Sphingomonas sp.]|uniref:TonB-dependent receptor n=1 Tax=Sphingomonas sp. TaxID=28214 RepID=UPI001B08351F|nr:TonB-dependent receptor [Sphingomonas sp.]MBO9623577.1 TonB-dependent receptor [Sphingomonas sp.]
MQKVTGVTKRFMLGASIATLAVASSWAGQARAQGTPSQPDTGATQAAPGDEQELIVTGVRQAEQSAIQRKKRAATAQDSIVADDVGQFPDKSAAEAIARIAGVALDVDDAGQQGGFTIRGQAADLIRVEVDGMTALPTNGDQGGRAVGIGDLSSDLIKSVDVVKGQTADMTPGGVGGTVRIEQRTALDFKKPFYRLNLQGQYNTLSDRVTPRINAIAAHKFFNDTFGILLNATYENQRTTTDFARVSDKQSGYVPMGDLDNSPEKSFTTPYDPIAAAVTTKAGCAALPTTGINSRLNCYAQWEDFVPTLPRFGRGVRGDERFSAQIRADWKPDDRVSMFVSYNPNIRHYSSQDYNLSIASPTGSTNASGVLASNITNAVVNENHYVTSYDMVRGTGVGTVGSLNWTNQVRDIYRNTAQYYTQAGVDLFLGKWTTKARVQYSLAKASREDRAFSFNAALPSASFSMIPENGLWTFAPPSSVDLSSPAAYYPQVGANGISANSQLEYTPEDNRSSEWNYQLDVTREFDDFGPLKSLKFGAQRRKYFNTAYRYNGFQIAPGVTLAHARSLDLIQFCSPALAPASAPCQFGETRRNTAANTTELLYKVHTLTEAQYQEVINNSLMRLPGANFFSGLPDRGNLLNSWMGYDFDKFWNTLGKYADLSDMNLDCLYECIASDGKTYTRPTYKTSEISTSAYAMIDFEQPILGMTLIGNAGVRYQKVTVHAQPVIDFSDRVAIAGTDANGLPTYTIQNNFIRREIGQVDRTSEDWLPSLNLALWPVDGVLGLRYSIGLQRARPSILQLTGNATVNCGKVNEADRAALEAFLASHPGAIDDGDPATDDADEASGIMTSFVNRCSGRIGNPELKGYGALTQNLSLEWYPNRDTQLSAAVYQINVRSGRPESVSFGNYELGGDEYEVDTYQDGPSGLRTRGYEIAGRTAFTFLPWIFKHTGGGFNYSYTKSNEQNTAIDPLTGTALPPKAESSYYYNVNFWYDDGRLNARVAYQARDIYYDRTEASSLNRTPTTPGVSGTNTTSYYKVVTPIFKDSTNSLDARASYRLSDMFQLFVEGKNLLNDSMSRFTPDTYRTIGGGTPYIFDTYYSGRTYYAGVIATF